jgi:hypothetical protein
MAHINILLSTTHTFRPGRNQFYWRVHGSQIPKPRHLPLRPQLLLMSSIDGGRSRCCTSKIRTCNNCYLSLGSESALFARIEVGPRRNSPIAVD